MLTTVVLHQFVWFICMLQYFQRNWALKDLGQDLAITSSGICVLRSGLVSQVFLNSLTMIILNILFFELLYGMNLNWFWFPFLYDFDFDCMLWSANCVKFVVLFYEFYEIIFLLYVYILLEILYSSFQLVD